MNRYLTHQRHGRSLHLNAERQRSYIPKKPERKKLPRRLRKYHKYPKPYSKPLDFLNPNLGLLVITYQTIGLRPSTFPKGPCTQIVYTLALKYSV